MIAPGMRFRAQCGPKYVSLASGKRRITAEIASSPLALARGLMGRNGLGKNRGMLLVFPRPGKHGIWTLGMRFAIDIVFLDGEYRVIHSVRNAKPLGLDPRTWKIYRPPKPATFALELAAGGAQNARRA